MSCALREIEATEEELNVKESSSPRMQSLHSMISDIGELYSRCDAAMDQKRRSLKAEEEETSESSGYPSDSGGCGGSGPLQQHIQSQSASTEAAESLSEALRRHERDEMVQLARSSAVDLQRGYRATQQSLHSLTAKHRELLSNNKALRSRLYDLENSAHSRLQTMDIWKLSTNSSFETDSADSVDSVPSGSLSPIMADTKSSSNTEWEEEAKKLSTENKRLQRLLDEERAASKEKLTVLEKRVSRLERLNLSDLNKQLEQKTMENDTLNDSLWQRDHFIETQRAALEAALSELDNLKVFGAVIPLIPC